MIISVIVGSPKGNNSISLQYIHYLTKERPGHEIEIINVGNRINQIERDESLFNEFMLLMSDSDAVIWSYPVFSTIFHRKNALPESKTLDLD